ncbi:hypothetical protein [Sinorhizobium fredii]|uniref:hypothetical protein n=1 Tax=Rhizobium fredii TaxID=380 RepID=UPI0004AE4E08|nr:hypothetical protein [Sinorhizobium fredii]
MKIRRLAADEPRSGALFIDDSRVSEGGDHIFALVGHTGSNLMASPIAVFLEISESI